MVPRPQPLGAVATGPQLEPNRCRAQALQASTAGPRQVVSNAIARVQSAGTAATTVASRRGAAPASTSVGLRSKGASDTVGRGGHRSSISGHTFAAARARGCQGGVGHPAAGCPLADSSRPKAPTPSAPRRRAPHARPGSEGNKAIAPPAVAHAATSPAAGAAGLGRSGIRQRSRLPGHDGSAAALATSTAPPTLHGSGTGAGAGASIGDACPSARVGSASKSLPSRVCSSGTAGDMGSFKGSRCLATPTAGPASEARIASEALLPAHPGMASANTVASPRAAEAEAAAAATLPAIAPPPQEVSPTEESHCGTREAPVFGGQGMSTPLALPATERSAAQCARDSCGGHWEVDTVRKGWAPLSPWLQPALRWAMSLQQERVEILIDPHTRTWLWDPASDLLGEKRRSQCDVFIAHPLERRMGKVGGERPRQVRWKKDPNHDIGDAATSTSAGSTTANSPATENNSPGIENGDKEQQYHLQCSPLGEPAKDEEDDPLMFTAKPSSGIILDVVIFERLLQGVSERYAHYRYASDRCWSTDLYSEDNAEDSDGPS